MLKRENPLKKSESSLFQRARLSDPSFRVKFTLKSTFFSPLIHTLSTILSHQPSKDRTIFGASDWIIVHSEKEWNLGHSTREWAYQFLLPHFISLFTQHFSASWTIGWTKKRSSNNKFFYNDCNQLHAVSLFLLGYANPGIKLKLTILSIWISKQNSCQIFIATAINF